MIVCTTVKPALSHLGRARRSAATRSRPCHGAAVSHDDGDASATESRCGLRRPRRPAEKSGHAPPPTLAPPHGPQVPASGASGASHTGLAGPGKPGVSWLCVAGTVYGPPAVAPPSAAAPPLPSIAAPSACGPCAHVRHSVPHALPPPVPQGAPTSALRAPLVHRLLRDGHPRRCASHCQRGDLSVPRRCNLV